MSGPGIDLPEVDTEAQVALPSGITVSSRVESADGKAVALRPSLGDLVDSALVAPGAAVQLQWQGSQLQRVAPAEVVAVESGVIVRWRLRITGPVELTQRREAVRGRLALPVEVGIGNVTVTGETSDLSEGGARIRLEGYGLPPEPGEPLTVRLQLEDGDVVLPAAVVRVAVRSDRWFLSTRFVGLDEKREDQLRRRVFQALREERARVSDTD